MHVYSRRDQDLEKRKMRVWVGEWRMRGRRAEESKEKPILLAQ